MLHLNFVTAPGASTLRILCLGAHADDIEIGCAGTILRLLESYPDVEVYWVVCSAAGPRRTEATASAQELTRQAGRTTIVVKRFRDGYFPYAGAQLKNYFERLKRQFSPDVIFTHYRDDLHQDHQQIAALTWNTFRQHLILEYEIPKYDGDLGTPNFFVHLDKSVAERKVRHVLTHFDTQRGKRWFTQDVFYSMLKIRGMEGNAPDLFAEGFYCRKLFF